MWSSYQEMYRNIDNEKMLIDKRLEMVRFANDNGIKKHPDFILVVKIQLKNGVEDMYYLV